MCRRDLTEIANERGFKLTEIANERGFKLMTISNLALFVTQIREHKKMTSRIEGSS